MKHVQRLVLLLLLLDLPFALPAAKKRGFSFPQHLGVAVRQADGVCLNIHNGSLSAGTKVTLVILSSPQSVAEAEVLHADSACPDVDKGDTGLRRYRLRVLKGELPPSLPSIAVSGSMGPFQLNGERVTADVDDDGLPESFRLCTSSEGIHLTVWSGTPLSGVLKWHQYYYLGYDVEPNCTSKDIVEKHGRREPKEI